MIATMVGQVTSAVHLILYVRDQAAAAFWRAALGQARTLTCPG